MKINELAPKHKMPHLYLDMDGVQADFFGAWSDKLGLTHWREISDKEKEINTLANSSDKEVYDFFRNLKPLKSGIELVNWLRKNNIFFTVLSAPLRGPFKESSKQAKRDWLDEHNPGTSSSAIFTSNKQEYAITNGIKNVLVDDFGPYIENWINAGGIAVKHAEEFEDPDTGKHTIERLEQIYRPYFDK